MAATPVMPPLAERLASARRAAGLSQQELAARMEVSRITVLEAERGRDARRSTLERWVAALPGVAPSDILPVDVPALPAATNGLWELDRIVAGGWAERLRVTVGRAGRAPEVSVHGARADGALSQADVERLLADAVRALPSAPPFAGAAEGACVLLRVPVRELVVTLPAGPSAAACACWPVGTEPDDAASEAGRFVLAGAACRRVAGGALEVVVECPPCHAWIAVTPSSGPRALAPDDGAADTVARRITRARLAAGLSLRELASRVGVSATSLSELEQGRDARASLLEALLAALPTLSPWALLPADRVVSRREAWLWHRDLVGCVADEERKAVMIDANGDAHLRLETRRLRALRPRSRDLVIQIGRTAGGRLRSEARLRAVEARDGLSSELRIVRAQEQGASHHLVVPAVQLVRGVSFVREMDHAGLYAVTAERARARGLEGDAFEEGASFASTVATERLRLTVDWPPGHEPQSLRAFCWPAWQPPDPQGRDVTDCLHPEGLEVRRRGNTAEIVVEHPVPHAKYGLGWTLP